MNQPDLYQQAMIIDTETGKPMPKFMMVVSPGGGGSDSVSSKTMILKTGVISKTTPMTVHKSEIKFISKILATSDESNGGSQLPPVSIHIDGVLFTALYPNSGAETVHIDFPNLEPSGDMIITTPLDMVTITVIGEGV